METGIVKYGITDAAIAKMEDLYMGLTITDIKNDEEFTAVHDARMVVKNHRVSVEKKRKELKAEALAWGKKVDGEANRIKGLLEPIENHLASEEKKITDEKERIKEKEEAAEKEKIQARVDALFAVNVVLPFIDVATMTDANYEDKLILATDAYRAEQQRLEEERKVKAEEEARLAIERAEIEKIKIEQEARAKAQAEREDALKRQERAIEEAKRKEQERIEREAFEKQAIENARIKAEADAKAKAEREAREKAEKEEAEKAEKRRLLEIAPDKDKLIVFANQLQDLTVKDLSLKSKKAQTLYNTTQEGLAAVIAGLRTKIGKL